MSDLVSRFTATLDELERVARFGGPAPWRRYIEGADDGWAIESTDAEVSFIVGDEDVATHIERWDPQAVLRLVAAAREVIAEHQPHVPGFRKLIDGVVEPPPEPVCSRCLNGLHRVPAPCPTVRALAAGFGVTEEG